MTTRQEQKEAMRAERIQREAAVRDEANREAWVRATKGLAIIVASWISEGLIRGGAYAVGIAVVAKLFGVI